jgi:pimeloyl-ACP methyl ester carboxylesterase
VVIGHSLGSVVALEFVRQHPGYPVDLLLTLGSPLGLRTVRDLMPDPGYGAERVPPSIGRWVNVRDPRDPVACAGALTQFWPGIAADHTVDNQDDAHSVTRYLGKWRTGAAVLAALPDLADTVP